MDWNRDLLDRLETGVPGGYFARGEAASEPTALAGLALAAHDRLGGARTAAEWLADQQAADGSIGVTSTRPTPCWPTSLAILLWDAIPAANGGESYRLRIDRAVEWALADRGLPHEQRPYVGHDTTLVGWSWAAHTHSWLEPTAMFVLALKAIGQREHPRTREAVRLVVDRLLPTGGCNYGNTFVLGQAILPHVQPTGIVMLALADEQVDDPRIELSLAYLRDEISADSTTASLCYGLMGLTAHDRRPRDASAWLEQAFRRERSGEANIYKLALIALALANSFPSGYEKSLTQSRQGAKT